MRWAAGGLRPKDWALLFGLKAALITTVVLVDRRYPWILTAERETEPPRSYTTEQAVTGSQPAPPLSQSHAETESGSDAEITH
jgi:hypothetical protein